jgi:hypothetical protein
VSSPGRDEIAYPDIIEKRGGRERGTNIEQVSERAARGTVRGVAQAVKEQVKDFLANKAQK